MSAFLYKWTGMANSAWHKEKEFCASIVDVNESKELIKLSDGNWYSADELEPMPMNRVVTPDMVNHPPHYTSHPSGIECIQVTEHFNFCVGNAIQYCWRSQLKHANPVIDLKKAKWYIEREIQRLEAGDGVENLP